MLKLEKLSKRIKGSPPEGDHDVYGYCTTNATLLLTVWYRLHDQLNKAKVCFQAQVRKGIAIFTDDDLGNDMEGYNTLGKTLFMAGNRDDAVAALCCILSSLGEHIRGRKTRRRRQAKEHKWLSDVMQPRDAPASKDACSVLLNQALVSIDISSSDVENDDAIEEEHTADTGTIFIWRCDGGCCRKIENYTALYFCEYCLNANFCDYCIKLLRAEKFSRRLCGPDHPMFQAYPVENSADNVATIKVDGKVSPRKGWLDNLRRERSS